MGSGVKNNSHAGTKWRVRCLKFVQGGLEARSRLALCTFMFFIWPPSRGARRGGAGAEVDGGAMSLVGLTRIVRPALLFAAAITLTAAWPVARQTTLKFSLDGPLEGLAATFFLPPDRGYFKTEGLDVTLDGTATMPEPITRVAWGAYDMGLADINTLIKYRDQHPSPRVRAVFMVYNKPPFAIVARRSRGITEPKQLENKKLGAPPTGITFGEWPLFAKLNNIDMSKVTIETIAIPVRAPMLAAGQIHPAPGSPFPLSPHLTHPPSP